MLKYLTKVKAYWVSLAWLSDGILWGVLLSVGIVGVITLTNLIQGQSETHRIYFKDVSQLTVGSPVHLMGTMIGYVTQVDPRGSKIEVVFKTNHGSPKIQPGSTYTIEFTGLVGAKSLEIIPPDGIAQDHRSGSSKTYFIDEPIRYQDAMNTQMEAARALESSSDNISKSLGDVRDNRGFYEQLQDVDSKLSAARKTVAEGKYQMTNGLSGFHQGVRHAQESVDDIAEAVDTAKNLTNKASFKPNTLQSVAALKSATEKTYHYLATFQNTGKLNTLQNVSLNTQNTINSVTQSSYQTLPNTLQALKNSENKLNQWNDAMSQVQVPNGQNGLQGALQKSQQLKEASEKLPK